MNNYYKSQMDKIDKPEYDTIQVVFKACNYESGKGEDTKHISLNKESAQVIVDKLKSMYNL